MNLEMFRIQKHIYNSFNSSKCQTHETLFKQTNKIMQKRLWNIMMEVWNQSDIFLPEKMQV